MDNIILNTISNETNNRKIINLLKNNENYIELLQYYNVDEAKELLWVYKNGIQYCNCGNKTKFISSIKGYKEFCSVSCASKYQGKERAIKGWAKNDRKKPNREEQTKKLRNTIKNRTLEEQENISKNKSLAALKSAKDNPDQYLKGVESRKKFYMEKYGVTHYSKTKEYKNKMKKTMVERGHWTPIELKDNLEIYRRKVWTITNTQDLKGIKDIDKRGMEFHLDHKFSIVEGFRSNIPTYIIGNINNLKILPAKENRQKIGKCSITKEELYKGVL